MNLIPLAPNFPTLETERLLLRLVADEDAYFIYRQFSDPEVNRYLKDEAPLTEISQARQIIDYYREPEGKNHNRWVIVRKSDSQALGTCGYHKWEPSCRRAEIGYDLSPQYWGQGYMTEALRAALENGFQRMELNRVDALVQPENRRSVLLLQKMGFQIEGTLRDYFYLDGKFYDHYLLALLRKDWVKC